MMVSGKKILVHWKVLRQLPGSLHEGMTFRENVVGVGSVKVSCFENVYPSLPSHTPTHCGALGEVIQRLALPGPNG